MDQHPGKTSMHGSHRVDTDRMLSGYEERAWEAYRKTAVDLAIPPLSDPLDAYIARRIEPTFSRIGFDPSFLRVLVGLAADAWNAPAAPASKVVAFHPNLRTDLDEVRQGLLVQSEVKMAPETSPAFLTPQASYEIVQQTMDPANLHMLLEEVITPWIVLPRAFSSLQEDQAEYLPAYLDMISGETNEEALHIFIRIAIEFLANFTIRFADAAHPREHVSRLVSSGYIAMFWKSLKTPPRGFEDVRVFEHFLNWLRYSGFQEDAEMEDIESAIHAMEDRRAYIFPSTSDLYRTGEDTPDSSRFQVALRHGCLGIACSVRYFWFPLMLPHDPKGHGVAPGTLLFALKGLFDLLISRSDKETRRTRYFVREFLFQLKNTYEQTSFEEPGIQYRDKADLKFIRGRILLMIREIQNTLMQNRL
jgi:hypothetical protein